MIELNIKQKKTITTATRVLLILKDDLYIHVIDIDVKQDDDENNVIFVYKRLQHPHGKLKQKTKNVEFDTETLTEVPFINIDALLDT